MADTSLWPIVASGLLTGLFALGGIAVGLVGASRRDVAQQRHEKAKRRAEKFEEMVAAVYEFDQWVQTHRYATVDRTQLPQATSPIVKVSDLGCLLSAVR
jgi:hypothetical protein